MEFIDAFKIAEKHYKEHGNQKIIKFKNYKNYVIFVGDSDFFNYTALCVNKKTGNVERVQVQELAEFSNPKK